MGRAEAERFTGKVEWADRFLATINGKRGFSKLPVYSVEELLRVAGGGAVVISGPAFAAWAEEVLGDAALAEAVREASVGVPLFSQAAIVLPLLAERHAQALAAVDGTSVPNAATPTI
jgi:hypothetical protein